MKKLALLALILICSAFPLLGQEAEWYVGKEIVDFNFVGLDSVGIGELKPIVRPYIGKPFDFELFWEIQGKLYELDYFDQVDADAQPGDESRNTVILEFRVTERPTVSEVNVQGNRRLGRAGIMDKVLIKRGDFVSQGEVLLDVENIKDFYIEKGFSDVSVSADRVMDKDTNTVAITFRIDEGTETRISEILFSGNNTISSNALKGELKTKEQRLFSSGAFRENQLQDDIAAIQSYYRERGYIDAEVVRVDRQVTTPEEDEDGRTFLVLTLYIKEGDQYLYGGMDYEGNSVFTNEQIDELLRLSAGTVLNMKKVEAEFQRLVSLYTDSGYIYNVIDRKELRDEATKTISYKITIQEFEKAHIETIILQGNEKTRDFVIYRELPFEEGDIFSVDKIRQGYLNLYNLQYFSAIDISPEEGSERGLMDVVISLEEQSWASFKFALAFSGGDFPVSGQVGWSDTNFLGTGRTVGVDIEGSVYKQGVGVNFQDDYLFGDQWGGGANLSFYHNKIQNVYQDIQPIIFIDEDVPDPYDSREAYEDALNAGDVDVATTSTMIYDSLDISTGINTGYAYRTTLGRLGLNTGLSSTMTYIWYDDDAYRPYSAVLRDNLRSWDFVNNWSTTLYWDNRDIFYNPTTGHYLSQYLGFTGGFLFGSRHFIKLTTRGDGYLTLLDKPLSDKYDLKLVLAGHSDISFILPQFGRHEAELTPSDTLAVDGMMVGRGWTYRSGYHTLWNNIVELRTPLFEQFLWWTWFFDAAVPWAEDTRLSMDIEDFYFSWGGGLRFTMPGLPIRLYLAQPFRFVDGQVEWQPGNIPLGKNMSLKFVISITLPGGF